MPAILTWDQAGAVWDEPGALWDGGTALLPWALEIWSLDGSTQLLAPAPFLTARITWSLEGPHAAEVELDETNIIEGDWAFGRRRLKLKDPEGVYRFHGFLERLERSGPPQKVRYTASALGLAGILERGVVHFEGEGLALFDTGPEVAWDLIENAQSQDDNFWNFTQGTIHGGAGGAHNRHYAEGDEIRAAIDDLADLEANGFDWDINVDGEFETWRPMRGTNYRDTIEIGEGDTTDFNVWADFHDALTYVTAKGETGFVTISPHIATFDAPLGRREITVEYPQEDDNTELIDRATRENNKHVHLRRGVRTTWLEGMGPWPFGMIWLGDAVNIDEGVGFGDETGPGADAQAFRCNQISLTLEPGTHEFVEMEWERIWPDLEGLPDGGSG